MIMILHELGHQHPALSFGYLSFNDMQILKVNISDLSQEKMMWLTEKSKLIKRAETFKLLSSSGLKSFLITIPTSNF